MVKALTLVAFLCVTLPLQAAEPAAAEQPVPFRVFGEHMVVVEGSIGRRDKLRFVLDTASTQSVVHGGLLRELRLTEEREKVVALNRPVVLAKAVVPSLRLGAIRLESFSLLVGDLSFIEREGGPRVAALIGMDVLGQRSFTLDYKARLLRFEVSARHSVSVPLESLDGLPLVEVAIRGERIRLVVDTGAPAVVVYDRRRRIYPLCDLLGRAAVSNLSGAVPAWRVRLPDLRLGGVELRRQPALLVEDAPFGERMDGLLGVNLLTSKSLSFDFERKRLTWNP